MRQSGAVSDVGQSADDVALIEERFHHLFGTSKADLRARGIDPGQYAREHIHDALKDKAKWDGILPLSNQYGILWTRWGWRGFVAMFIGLGLLGLSNVHSIHWVAIGAACVDLLAVLAMYTAMVLYRRRYIEACRAEGKAPTWSRRLTPNDPY